MSTAFDSYELGGNRLANRIVMAPMTRSRAYGPGATATELMATYYAQRASAGLIVTEGTQPSPIGQGYPDTPGIHSAEQVAAWRKVTDAVHAKGGVIFLQIMHTGRVGHSSWSRRQPVGPSAVRAAGQIYTHDGLKDYIADLIAYGALFLANPDLPARLRQGGPYNTPDRAKSFGGDEKGFTDYPTLA